MLKSISDIRLWLCGIKRLNWHTKPPSPCLTHPNPFCLFCLAHLSGKCSLWPILGIVCFFSIHSAVLKSKVLGLQRDSKEVEYIISQTDSYLKLWKETSRYWRSVTLPEGDFQDISMLQSKLEDWNHKLYNKEKEFTEVRPSHFWEEKNCSK